MIWLHVPAKTGYRALTDISVFDHEGGAFYATTAGNRFNLPRGDFRLSGKVERLPVPLSYELAIHAFERDDRPYREVIVKACNNPNKASVIFENGIARIFIDHSIAKMPMACRCYVISHELAHAHYVGSTPQELETMCDEYGEHRLLDRGFNPSQLAAANKLLLKSGWRKDACMHRMLTNFAK